MKTTVIHPTTFKLDGGAMFGIIPKPLWEKKISPDNLNRITMSLRLVLFETKNKKILIDTGIGDHHGEKFNSQFAIKNTNNALETALKEANIKASEITDIVLTHLHFDHVGGLGNGQDGTSPLFPNATVHVHKKHLEYSQNATQRDQNSFHTKTFLPLLSFYRDKKQLNLLEKIEGTLIEDDGEAIFYKTSFGHTPYMIHPFNDRYIYMADLVPMDHHVHIPWVMGYDIEPAVTTTYKQDFYDMITEKNLSLIYEHDDDTVCANIEFNGKKYLPVNPIMSNKMQVQEI